MKLLPNGDKIFEVISRYEDLLTLEDRNGHEPGDALALILPFLVLHNISENDIASLATKASLTDGAERLIAWLQSKVWRIFCITTTYEQYAIHITHKLAIYAHNLAYTPLPWDKLQLTLSDEDLALLKQTEEDMLTMQPVTDDDRIKQNLDYFFREKLPTTNLGEVIREVKPVGGQRKLDALIRFADKYGQPLTNWVVVGDSITDFRMLQAVDSAGGLAIAFNATEPALHYSTMSLASKSISNLTGVLEAWGKSQRRKVEELVKEREKDGGSDDRGYFHWLSGRKDIDKIVEVHKSIRRLVREETKKSG